MIRRSLGTLALALAIAAIGVAARQAPPQSNVTAKPSGSGWQLPPDAASTKNPLTVDAKVLATGKAIFKERCQKCHGASGRGDGPDADPDVQEDMDLTTPKRADRNPDGVVFYKAWNGRKKPKMPAVKDELTKEQLWAVVAYVQTLRKTSVP
jgi:mono/diheme cytochrome c family protein